MHDDWMSEVILFILYYQSIRLYQFLGNRGCANMCMGHVPTRLNDYRTAEWNADA